MCLLSLCIPTYNRSRLLSESLRAILSQIDASAAAQVEVVVMDNASPDDTPQVVAQAQAEFPLAPVRVVRHRENIGADANFRAAVEQAQGEFVYLLSDDDVLLPGAVNRLLSLIRAHPDFDAFCLNVRPFLHQIDEDAAPAFLLDEDRIIVGRDAALVFLRNHITFMSAMAFRRQNMIGRDYKDKVGTVLLQCYFFLDALAPGRGVYVSQEAGLAQRMDNTGPFDFFKVFVTNFQAVLDYAAQIGYSKQAIRQVQSRHLRFLKSQSVRFLVSGSGGMRAEYRGVPARLLKAYGPNPYVLFILLPVILFPQALARPLLAVYRRLKRASPRQQLPSHPTPDRP